MTTMAITVPGRLRVYVLALALTIFVATTVCASPSGFGHKAILNERAASILAGGFDAEQRRAYHDGLVYLRSVHSVLCGFTIAQVIGEGRVHHAPMPPPPPSSSTADSSADSSFNPGIFIVLGLVVLLTVWLLRGSKKASVANTTTEATIAEATSGVLQPFDSMPIAQHSDERFYLSCGEAQLIAEHHHARYVGGYGGFSFRVARGVYARTGASRGRRVDSVTVDVDDTGALYASNQRIVFVGSQRTIDIPLSRVVNIDAYTDGFKINRSNESAIVIRTGRATTAIVLRRIVAGDIVDPKVAEKDFLEKRAALLKEANVVFAEAQKQHAAGLMSDAHFQKASEAIDGFRRRATSKPPVPES